MRVGTRGKLRNDVTQKNRKHILSAKKVFRTPANIRAAANIRDPVNIRAAANISAPARYVWAPEKKSF